MSGAVRLRRITPADHRIMPWKNGLGFTREIAIDPPGATMTDAGFRWRLSIATVHQSGPFSQFPGIDRTIMVIDGKGMELAVAGRAPHRLDHRFVPFSFPGDAATECKLIDGPIQDFNLMVARKLLSASSETLEIREPFHIRPPGDVCIVQLLAGETAIVAGDVCINCSAGDTAIADGAGALSALQLNPVGTAIVASMQLNWRDQNLPA